MTVANTTALYSSTELQEIIDGLQSSGSMTYMNAQQQAVWVLEELNDATPFSVQYVLQVLETMPRSN